MKNMLFVLFVTAVFPTASLPAQESVDHSIAGFHIGVVQPLLASHEGEMQYIDEYDFYAIGFPMGITFHTSGKLLFDMEFVPFVKPYANSDHPYEVHLLFHPGILVPLGHGFTFGLRAAFETGTGQFGFTPLLNKAFRVSDSHVFFVELVAPGRFGPEKDSGYTQVAGLHLGFGF